MFSLYPYNLNGSAYITVGEYSTGPEYVSQTLVTAIDRRSKDMLAVSLENLSISTDSTYFHQQNLMMRGLWWIRPEIRIGAIGGVYHSNEADEGWLAGVQVEGEWRDIGYSISADRLSATISTARWDSISLFNWDLVFTPQARQVIHIGAGLSYRFYKDYLVFEAGATAGTGKKNSREYLYNAGVTFTPSNWTLIALSGKYGKGSYLFDPLLMSLDNNPNRFNNSYSGKITQRFITNLSLTAAFSKSSYTSTYTPIRGIPGELSYTVTYYTVGVLIRF